jgi:hypothetical protein
VTISRRAPTAIRPRAGLAALLPIPPLLAALACGERRAAGEGQASVAVAVCTEVSVDCGAAPSARFDADGRLWVAFEQQEHVWVAASDDLGARFTTPVRVHAEPETIETNGENRPKIAFGPPGTLFVAWTRKVPGGFNGEIRFSRSLDGGRSFEPVRTINDDGLLTGHRFDSLHVDGAGDVYLAWVDKRDLEAARARGEEYRGAAVYSTVSTDRGATFAANRRVADHACECCRIGITDAGERGAALLWRHVFEGDIRDHAFATIGVEGGTGEPRRLASTPGGSDHPFVLSRGAEAYLAWHTAAEGLRIVPVSES